MIYSLNDPDKSPSYNDENVFIFAVAGVAMNG